MIRISVFLIGMAVMAFGIAMMIRADLGSAPWDVLHIGLYKQLGLTIGTWSIIIGCMILGMSSILEREWPKAGAFVNMVLVGVFIDVYLLMPWFKTPEMLIFQWTMLLAGIMIIGFGIGMYISANLGAGPRDSLMLALTKRTGWPVRRIRSAMEMIVLTCGWLLGGPVFWGTLIFTFGIGPVVGVTLPMCERSMTYLLNRRDQNENIDKRKIRSNHYDRVG
ncbi:YczE/YyaS/YitT family protein [Aureibacillus halotolerans]|uniref:Membrane protein YczE n=1 Tax=Aureibacillus halotolerans TaxID=1508390 RepID=A0A4R6TWY1_9BACI|nr:YitT family protein [Aureibacillus halotolerans]TDQ38001.1 hypothetical protein EV213_11182 [Aureibacillus halotolerans]